MSDPVKEFWNQRATFGVTAGTNDFMLTEIEQKFIASEVPNSTRVMDIGCGNAMSLIKLARENNCTGVGIDYAEGMVAIARDRVLGEQLQEKIEIHHRRIPPVPNEWGVFDVVLSNRCLINLKTTEQQKEAVQSVAALLRSGGTYLMIECSWEGGEATNALRVMMGLERIEPPWHNLFFKQADVESWQSKDFYIESLRHISSTYHFLSRVVYAKLAAERGEELCYDSEINKLAIRLPQQTGQFGPVKAWVWKKR